MKRRVAEHDFSDLAPEVCNQQYKKWYASCLHIDHMTHVARNIAARAAKAQAKPSDELIEMSRYALGQLHQAALESMADLRKNDLPDDAQFPKTRHQLRKQAIEDHAEVEEIHRAFSTRLAAAKADAENSAGRCHVCGGALRADDVRSHAATCFMDAVQNRYTFQEVEERYARSQPLLVWVRSEELRHWMMLIMQPTTSLRQLDRFLRDTWLECCGHMSHFEMGIIRNFSQQASGQSRYRLVDLARHASPVI